MLMTILVFLLTSAVKIEAVEIDCEKIDRYHRGVKCCYLHETTVIDVINTTMGGLEIADVQEIWISGNKNIQYLPVNVYKKFPNLEFYSAYGAGITEISALNFERLTNLKILNLSENNIESIPDNCFQGLFKLSKVNFCR